MAQQTNIEWTESTWNPWKGCHKVSQGCKNCYMFREQHRWGNDPNVVTRTKKFNEPLKWKEPRLIFTCSWSDFFIEEADQWRAEAWEIIRKTPQHTYQILTKRPERIKQCLPDFELANVWIGVTVENQEQAWERIQFLDKTPFKVRFLSIEPILSEIILCDFDGAETLNYLSGISTVNGMFEYQFSNGIDWVIVGGESGPNARPAFIEWLRTIHDQCKKAGVPFFMKQLGGVVNKRDKMEDFPEDLQIREFPKVWSKK